MPMQVLQICTSQRSPIFPSTSDVDLVEDLKGYVVKRGQAGPEQQVRLHPEELGSPHQQRDHSCAPARPIT